MCGIAGVLKVHNPDEGPVPSHHESIPDAWLDVLDDSIKHRGPDGAGRFRDRVRREDGTVVDVALVHRRLSIIDLAGGSQPMVHVRRAECDPGGVKPGLVLPTRFIEDRIGGRPEGIGVIDVTGETEPVPEHIRGAKDLVAVAFNGCIYNHRELRAELEACGHRFETDHSDTEVLVHGWREWGLRIQGRLDGMYAALTWDRRTGQLSWGLDRSGEKPLTHSVPRENTRVFASCCPGLARVQAVCNPAYVRAYLPGIEDWLRFGADLVPAVPAYTNTPGEHSIQPKDPPRGGRVRSGEAVHIVTRVDQIPAERSGPNDAGLAQDRLKTLLEAAVVSRLDADVPVGVFLSGGIDSAIISAVAKRYHAGLKTFTVRMPDPRYDESRAAEETARYLGTDHTTLNCEPMPSEDLVHLIEQLGLPFGDSSLLPTYWVARASREHVKVALSGDGGDELFGGYRRHTICPLLNRKRRLLSLIPARLLDQRLPGTRSTYLARLGVAARNEGYTELLSIFETPDLARLVHSIDGQPIESGGFRPTADPLRHDFCRYLPDDLLRKTDTASMAVGLEVRAPFLARDLVNAALQTPLDVLMPGDERKGLLKQVARTYLPNHIVNRPKQGFAVPIGEWFRSDYGGMRQLLHDHLESADPFPGLAEAGVELNMGYIKQILREHAAAGERSLNPWHGRDHSQRLYMLLVLSIWSRWLAGVRAGAAG